MVVRLFGNLKELYRFRVLIQNLVSRELKARYRGTVLGFLWSFFNPLLLMIVYTLVFGLILKGGRGVEFDKSTSYAVFLFTGLLPWTWFSASSLESANVLMVNGNLIKKILFPAEILPVVTVLSNLVHFSFGLPILLVFLFVFGKGLTLWALLLPVVMLIQMTFSLGFGLLISSLAVHFRDIRDILANLLTLWFFSTPVIYPLTFGSLQESSFLRTLINLNPMTHIIEGYHSCLFYGTPLHWKRLGITLLASLVLFVIGYAVFDRLRDSFPEEV